jgi:peptidoglycan/xylan/chitin deacetylase (PgdA/CDA1 family)
MTPLLLINYHYIRDPHGHPHPGIHPISMAALAKQVDGLLAALHPASIEEFADYAAGHDRLPGPAFFLTFDDGMVDHVHAAREVLAPRGLQAGFFVSSRPLAEDKAIGTHKLHWLRATTPPEQFREDFLDRLPGLWRTRLKDPELAQAAAETNRYDRPETAQLKYMINFHLPYELMDEITSQMLRERDVDEAEFCRELYMNAEHLRELERMGHRIGCHGHAHQPMSRMSPDALDADFARSQDCLSAIVGHPLNWLAYPWGNDWAIPRDADKLCRAHGFDLAITLKRAWNDGRQSPYLLNRCNTNEVEKLLAAVVNK